jgi:hypothetical protein
MINRLLAWFEISATVSQQQTMRFPVYLTLILAFMAIATSLMFSESFAPAGSRDSSSRFSHNLIAAFRLTMKAGRWITATPFALAIIVCGMFYDHILRMLITMTSQYLRLIHLPEASFGLISAALSLFGLIIPKLCEKMISDNSPQKNLFILFVITLAGLFGTAGFFPYIGLLPISLIFVAIMMVSFFTSHYLNRITDSSQRATVLSFKGMAFNLGYGMIGVFFAMLMQQLRADSAAIHPGWSTDLVERSSFITAVGWFPWYTLILFACLLLYFRNKLRNTADHKIRG